MGLSPNLLASTERYRITPVSPERNLLVKYADDLTLSVPVSADQDHSSTEVNSAEN